MNPCACLMCTIKIYIDCGMLKYFLEEEQQQPGEVTKSILKTHFIMKRDYTPFHIDCQYTKKKLCYCQAHAYSHIAKDNRPKVWKSYQPVHDYYAGVQQPQVQRAAKVFQHCRDKIRKLSRAQTAQFIRNLRSEKSMHMGENGQYQNM